MNEMSEAIRSAIAANLPAAAAGELAAFIKQAEADRAALVNVRRDLDLAQRETEQVRKQLSEQTAIDKKLEALAAGQAQLQAEQIKLAFANARAVADIADASKTATLDTVAMFLRLPSVRTNITSSVAVPVEGHPGSPSSGIYPVGGTVMAAQESHFTTQTQE